MTKSKCRTALLALAATLAFGALTAASALASEKPSVETKPATGISETKATLNGIVNPHGAETKYHFDYGGPNGLYTKHSAEMSAGSGTSNVEESQAVAELAPNTIYHFRIVATNLNGTTNGSDQVFTTTSIPGPPEFAGTGFPKPLTISTSKKPVEFTVVGGTGHITCSNGVTGVGQITGAKSLTASLTFTGCRLIGFGSVSCNSAGAAAEEIKTGSLDSGLFYISKAAKEVGIVFNFRGNGPFAVATCSTHKVEVHQGPIAPITPINTPVATHTLTLKVSSRVQIPTQYENELGAKIGYIPLINIPSESVFEQGGISTEGMTLVTANTIEVTG